MHGVPGAQLLEGVSPGFPGVRRLRAPGCVHSPPARVGLAVVWAGVKCVLMPLPQEARGLCYDSLHEVRNFVNLAVFLPLFNFGWVAAAEAF